MSGTLLIESRTVRFGGFIPVIAQHLYLIYQDDKGKEYTIRGGPENEGDLSNLLRTGDISVQNGILLEDSRDARKTQSPSQRNQKIVDLGSREAKEVWGILMQHAQNIHDSGLDYQLLSQNSNSTIASVLNAVGINIFKNMPKGISPSLSPGVENFLTFGTNLIGGNSNDFIVGGQGKDCLKGGYGDDILIGDDVKEFDTSSAKRERDRLFGGPGNDVLIANHFYDAIIPERHYSSHLFSSRINAAQSSYSGDKIIELAIKQVNFSKQLGGGLARVLPKTIDPSRNQYSGLSNSLGNSLSGGSGDDVLVGGDAKDTLKGRSGSDFLFAGLGDDTVIAGRGNDTLFGAAGHDSLYGNFHNNVIDGGPGDDRIFGGVSKGGSSGTDTLTGSQGNDRIDGNSGLDTVVVDPFLGKTNVPIQLGTDTLIEVETLKIDTNDRPYILRKKYSTTHPKAIYSLFIGDKIIWRGIDKKGHLQQALDFNNNPLPAIAQNVEFVYEA